jgi:hypothetical protein
LKAAVTEDSCGAGWHKRDACARLEGEQQAQAAADDAAGGALDIPARRLVARLVSAYMYTSRNNAHLQHKMMLGAAGQFCLKKKH